MSSDPVFNGRPISELKVVELRKILDEFELSKSGVKKDLFERLRDYLNSQDDGCEKAEAEAQEVETTSRPSTRSSASPRKAVSPIKSPAKASSPVKSPPPTTNKYVAQYLQNQQATLEEIKRTELLKEASDNAAAEVTTTSADPVVEVLSTSEITTTSVVPVIEVVPAEEVTKTSVGPVIEVIPAEEVTTTSVEPVIEVIPAAERDEVSSTVSNAGSDNAPQAIPDDASIIKESKSENVPQSEIEQEISDLEEVQSVNMQLIEDVPVESVSEALPEEKAPSEKNESSSESESSKEGSSSSDSEEGESKSVTKETIEIKMTSVDETERAVSPKKVDEFEKKEAKKEEPKDESAVELDYDEEESTEPAKTVEERSEKEKSATPVTAKKHRAIVFDLDNKSKDKSDSAPISTSHKTISIRPTVAVKPSEQPSEYGTNSLGNVRERPLSPARNEPTECIHITQLKRPYVLTNLQAVLRTFGEFSDEDFWIDNFRSNCIVKYNSVESAQKARDELHSVRWPDDKAPVISVDYTTEEKLLRQRADPSNRKSSSGAAVEKSGLIIHVSNDRKLSTEKDDNVSENSTESRKRKATPPQKSTKDLDELFKKTKAKPQIYYLPLNDEEIAAKKQRRKH